MARVAQYKVSQAQRQGLLTAQAVAVAVVVQALDLMVRQAVVAVMVQVAQAFQAKATLAVRATELTQVVAVAVRLA